MRFLLTVVTLVATAAYASDAQFERTLGTGSSPSVSVHTGSGYIHLRPGSGNQVHIAGHVRASSGMSDFISGLAGSRDPDSRIKQIVSSPPITQNGNEIQIGDRQHSELYRNIAIDYDITLPRASNLETVTGSGDIEIQDVGASLKARTGSGGIRASGVQGATSLGTGSGSIELHHAGTGDVEAKTGSGLIHLFGVAGALSASTGSGGIQVEGQPSGGWNISTGSGSVYLALGGSARFNLDAHTGSGSIRVEQAVASTAGSSSRHRVTGAVNGGGPLVHVSTGSGSISIR